MELASSGTLLALLVALFPGALAWWTGRQLDADDPALPELLLARQQRLAKITIIATIVLWLLFAAHALWAIPLELLALLGARFRFRRALFGETWSFLAYFRYSTFEPIGKLGLWLGVALAPAVVLALVNEWTPPPSQAALPVAAVLGVAAGIGLLLWQRNFVAIWLDLHRATPLVDDGTSARRDLLGRFAAVLDRAGASIHERPAVYRYGVPGAHILNAVALPSVRRPAVAMSDRLLEMLTPDELTAIFAHEVAHHEHHNPRRLRAGRRKALGVIAAAMLLPVALLPLGQPAASVVSWLWPLMVLCLIGRRVGNVRAHETRSDLRAAALTGGPGALARALTRLHVISRVPRRWPHDFEQAATHPSLARRIQAIDAGGAAAVATLGAPTILASSTPGSYVALDGTRAHWFDGVPDESAAAGGIVSLREHATSYRAVSYADLTELRVTAAGAARALRGTDRGGSSWTVPLRPEDVARAQQALDLVDVRLGRAAAGGAARAPVARLWILVMLIGMSLAADGGVLVIPALIAAIWPGAMGTLAMGTMALARVLIAATAPDAAWMPSALRGIGLLMMSAAGVWCAWGGWRWARAETGNSRPPLPQGRTNGDRFFLVGFGLTGIGCVLLALPRLTESMPSLLGDPVAAALATLLAGAGALLVARTHRPARLLGGLSLLAAMIGSAAVSLRERLFAPGLGVTRSSVSLAAVAHVPVPPESYQLLLSPTGRHFATRHVVRSSNEGIAFRYAVGGVAPGAAQRSFDAVQALFVDDERMLVLADAGDSLELRLQAVQGGGIPALWRHSFPRLADPRLLLDRTSGRWNLWGMPAGGPPRGVFMATGSVTGGSVATVADSIGRPGDQVLFAFGDGTTLGSSLEISRDGPEGFGSIVALVRALFSGSIVRVALWRNAGGVRRTVARVNGTVTCGDEEIGGAALCAGTERGDVRVMRVGRDGAVTDLARIPGLFARQKIAGGVLVGQTPLARAVELYDMRARRLLRGTLPQPDGEFTMDIAVAPGLVAVLGREPTDQDGDGPERATVTLFRIDKR